jgi:diacylglycerol kinase
MASGKFSIKSRLRSFNFAFKGIWSLFREEPNSRIHFIGAVVAVFLGIFLRISLLEWSLIAIVAGMVFIAELINTALETLSDIVDPEWNEKIRKVKDYSAAAVLISAIISLVVGTLIFLPGILNLFRITD